MKLSKIADLCRKGKSANLHIHPESKGEGVIQYIGTGGFIYAVDGLPRLTKESALSVFDVPSDAREDFGFYETDIRELVMQDVPMEEVEREAVRVGFLGHDFACFNVGGDILFINEKGFAPLKDEMDDIEFKCRSICDAKAIVATRGFEVRAILCESKFIPFRLEAVDSLNAIAHSAHEQYDEEQARKETSEIGQPDQISMMEGNSDA
jgi:hypothetical protein